MPVAPCRPKWKGTMTGGGNDVSLKTQTVPIVLSFSGAITQVRDDRTGKAWGDGKEFHLDWPMSQAIIVSLAGAPPS